MHFFILVLALLISTSSLYAASQEEEPKPLSRRSSSPTLSTPISKKQYPQGLNPFLNKRDPLGLEEIDPLETYSLFIADQSAQLQQVRSIPGEYSHLANTIKEKIILEFSKIIGELRTLRAQVRVHEHRKPAPNPGFSDEYCARQRLRQLEWDQNPQECLENHILGSFGKLLAAKDKAIEALSAPLWRFSHPDPNAEEIFFYNGLIEAWAINLEQATPAEYEVVSETVYQQLTGRLSLLIEGERELENHIDAFYAEDDSLPNRYEETSSSEAHRILNNIIVSGLSGAELSSDQLPSLIGCALRRELPGLFGVLIRRGRDLIQERNSLYAFFLE